MAEVIQQTQSIVIDKIQVLSLIINVWPENQKAIGVNYAVGYENAEGNFIAVEQQKQKAFEGEEFIRVVSIQADGTLNLYENIKAVLYAEL